jgi:putative transcriptional regulator
MLGMRRWRLDHLSATVAVAVAIALAAGPAGLEVRDEAAARPALQRGRGAVPALSAGSFLVAARKLADPNFAQSVVLLFAYSPRDGAAGLIVNRRTNVSVRRVVPELVAPRGLEPVVFFGGPVSAPEVRGLLRLPAFGIEARRILPDVALLMSIEAIEQAAEAGATIDRLRLYSGYAGWSPGQLEREFERGDWHLSTGDASLVFAVDPEAVWRRQIQLTDVLAL